MAIVYTDAVVANLVERDIENFARAITDSYCQNQPNVKNMDAATFAKAYFNVFKHSLQTIEKQIETIKQKENEEQKRRE